MKASDIVKELRHSFSSVNVNFSDQLSVSSIVPSGSEATVTTATNHNLSIGDDFNITGSTAPIDVLSINRAGTEATIITVSNHDITVNKAKPYHTKVLLDGFNEPEFNGEFDLISAENRKTFKILVADSGAVVGTGPGRLIDPGDPFGFNGLNKVKNVIDPTSFTYDLAKPLLSNAAGTIILNTNIKIGRVASLSRAYDIYTQQTNSYYCFVQLGDVVSSRDRKTKNDGVSSAAPGQSRRQQILQTANIYVFMPVSESLTAAKARDEVEEFIFPQINKSICSIKFGNYLSEKQQTGLTFVSHGTQSYNEAGESFGQSVYVHVIEYQLLTAINDDDTNTHDASVAFRDIDITYDLDVGTGDLGSEINLDDNPI